MTDTQNTDQNTPEKMPEKMPEKTRDVVGVGNAILDILVQCEDRFLDDQGLKKGVMTLVEEAEFARLYEASGPAVEVSGGSVANTLAGVASFDGTGAFIGKVRDDQFGKVFRHDIAGLGMDFTGTPATEGPATATCLSFVTPDGQRTMQTYLGIAGALTAEDVDADLIASARILMLEGYLWDTPNGPEVFRTAVGAAKAAGTKVALSLSDPWVVDRHREPLHTLVKESVDILFANEQEVTALFQTVNLEDAVEIVDSICPYAAITRGPDGSIIADRGARHEITAETVEMVVDTTGAGDLYAAGVLYGLSQNMDPTACGRLGSMAAAEVISHMGARPETSLAALMKQKLAA